ncbi:GH1 family beta-glucosidase [Gryllotalpicola reticulitermitis]|uniref:Beta-glucosidase n=1 Tax=Gryllotalpicola reticulitermitis TaxID=1184153 RepID=A0ABV8Q439_9MICO
MTRRSDFPSDFAWGTATASYQIEGGVADDGRTPSIWDTFTHTPGTVSDGNVGDVADDSYHLWRDDIAVMRELGVNAYRFSISWSRLVTPDGELNPAGVEYYRTLAAELNDRGITPWATLYHWDLPQYLEDADGWLNRATVDAFVHYVELAVQSLGDVIDHWITLNEPWCSAFLGYASGHHAPGRHVGSQAAHAAHHLLLGHGRGVAVIRRLQPEASVGITLNLYSVRAASDSDADRDAARRADGLQNRLFLEPVLTGRYPADVLADLGEEAWFGERTEDLAEIAQPIDFLGINYYSRHTAAAGERDADTSATPSANPGSEFVRFIDTGATKTQMGWEIHPDGLIDVLEQAHAYAPELPLYITENGSAWPDVVQPDGRVDDPERQEYLEQHVAACAAAIGRGLPLRGYFIWTLIDNFEWAWGFSRRFGLAYVDYATQRRTVKSSGTWLAGFLSGALEAPDGVPAQAAR